MNEFLWVDCILAALTWIVFWQCVMESTGWGDYPLGNDGLSDNERADYAWQYEQGVGNKKISQQEREAMDAWLESKRRLND